MSQSFEMLTVEEHQLYPCHPNLSSVKDPCPCCSQQCSLCLSLFHPFLCLCLLFLCPWSWAESQHFSRLGSSFCSWTIDWTSPFQTQPSVRPSPSLTDFKRKHNKHALPARGNGLSLVGWCSVGFPGVLAKRVDFNVKSTEIIALSARHEKQHSLCLKLLVPGASNSTPQKSSLLPLPCAQFVCRPTSTRPGLRSLRRHCHREAVQCAFVGRPSQGSMENRSKTGWKIRIWGALCHKHQRRCWDCLVGLPVETFGTLPSRGDWKGHCLQSSYFSHERSIGQIGLSYVSYHITTCIEESEWTSQ